jgi:hypothetical protein
MHNVLPEADSFRVLVAIMHGAVIAGHPCEAQAVGVRHSFRRNMDRLTELQVLAVFCHDATLLFVIQHGNGIDFYQRVWSQ